MSGKVTAVVGLQYGDEGKGKIVDYLAEKNDVVVRGNGGANAGHTIVLANGKALALHQIPSGIAYENKINIIGNGCYVDPVKLASEIDDAESKGVKITKNNLKISKSAHLVLPIHKQKDAQREDSNAAQASTKSGIAYVAADKALREGVRVEIILQKNLSELSKLGDKEFADCAKKLEEYICESVDVIQSSIEKNKNILLEGAQAFGLDINHGKYPYVTSSDTTVSGLLSGSGINYRQVNKAIGVAKAIPSKVGGGNFVTKISDKKIADDTRGIKGNVDSEFGATTGREREVGYLDLVALKRAVQVNGVGEIALTKFDCINRHGEKTKVAIAYRFDNQKITSPPSSNYDLAKCEPVYQDFETWSDPNSAAAKSYVEFIEGYLGVPVSMLGIGPGREDLIIK